MNARRHHRAGLVIAGAVAIGYLLPFLYVAQSSFKPSALIVTLPPVMVFRPTLAHYADVLRNLSFDKYLLNSVIVTAVATTAAVLFGSAAAYGVSRFGVGRNLAIWILLGRMVPPITIVLPFFLLYRAFNLIDTRLGLILAYTAFNLPMVIWLLIGFFEGTPREYDEAAKIDGANLLQIIAYIVWPIARPGLAATAILTAIYSWNEFLFALILTTERARTAPVGMTQFISEYTIAWGSLAAGGLTISLPILVFMVFMRQHLVRGLAGQLK